MKKNIQWRWIIITIVIIVVLLVLFKFNNKTSVFNEKEAIQKVKNFPEVKDYLKRVPQAQVAVNGEENNAYKVQVYEFKDNHTATFNWYSVEKTTGAVAKEF